MRVVVWNMAANTVSKSPAVHEEAWRYLRDLDPDLALVQEVRPPDWVSAGTGWSIVHAPFKLWVSAVIAKSALRLTEFSDPDVSSLDDGFLATGTVTLPDGSTLLAGSVHTVIGPASSDELGALDPETVRTPRYKVPYRRDVAYAIYRNRVKRRRFLVGGDWNTSRKWDRYYKGASEIDFFHRAEHDGWVDCYMRFHGNEGRSLFKVGTRPYQNDHVFCDPLTAMQLQSCEIDAEPAEKLGLSDHAPLVLDIRS